MSRRKDRDRIKLAVIIAVAAEEAGVSFADMLTLVNARVAELLAENAR